jgi:predicted phage terminase large subunit-like protein
MDVGSGGYVRSLIRKRGEDYWRKSRIADMAANRLARLNAALPENEPGWDPVPLMEWIPQVSPGLSEPMHLAPLVERLERAHLEPLEFAFSVPPRHFKTWTVGHAVAWWWKQDPTLPIAYVSYGHDFAAGRGQEIKRIVQRAGVRLGGRQREDDWETAQGGRLKCAGIRGQFTGEGFRVIIVDDPHKNREEAESGVVRRRVVDGFWNDIYTRRLAEGTSVIVVHTRWHPDDLIGNLTRRAEAGETREPFEYVNLPAMSDGEALAPDFFPAQELERVKASVGEYAWASLYMGNPRPRGKELFGDATTCAWADVPTQGRDTIGVDLAYTAKTQADYSVAVVLRKVGEAFYLVDVKREQVQAPDFGSTLKRLAAAHQGSPMWWYASGTEKGAADFMVRDGVPLTVKPATSDKFVRAQPVSAAWNDGKILVPRDAPWSRAVIAEVTSFTGINDPHDDIVDALAAAYDVAAAGYGEAKSRAWGERPTRALRKAF